MANAKKQTSQKFFKIKFIKSFITVVSLPVIIGLVICSLVSAEETAVVTATVKAQSVSVSVSDGTVAYGIIALSSSKSTLAGELNDQQTATNNGNITENFNIKGQNSANWTLAGAIGSEQYKHEFSVTAAFPGTALTTNYQTLATSIAQSGNQAFDLKLYTPSSTAFYTQQTVSLIVQAVAS